MNENGQQLLELCIFHNLCITNSFFKTKPQHKVSWRHPCSKHWHQLDLTLVRHAPIKNVLHTHSYHSADCDTDHSLVCCKIRLQPKKFHHAKKLGNPYIDVSKMTQPDLVEWFAEAFDEEYDASQSRDTAMEKWETLQDTIHHITLPIFRKKTSKSHDWYETKSLEMTPIIEAKHAALVEYKWPPTEWNLQTLTAARSKVQCIARCCSNEYWTEHSEMIQIATAMGNIRWMYDGTKKALGPMQSKVAPLKSATGEIITDQGWQMERWVEHYSNLYSRVITVTPQPWAQSSACQSWKSLMQSQPWMSSARSLTVWPQARHKASTVFLQTSSSTARPPYCTTCMKSSASAGERELYCKT